LRDGDPAPLSGITQVPRNAFVGKPVHRADVRFQLSLKFGGRRSADLIAEVFNAFDRANYGSYSSNLAYAPRTIQLGFRLTFQRYPGRR